MKILKHTASELSLHNPIPWSNKVFLGIWAVLGQGLPLLVLLSLVFSLGASRRNCQQLGSIQLGQTHLLPFKPFEKRTFTPVAAAEISTQLVSKRLVASNKVILSQTPDDCTQTSQISAIFMLTIFLVVGLGVPYFAWQSETLIFDKSTQQFRCIRYTLLGKRTWQCPLHEIHDVTINITRHKKNSNTYTYTLTLLPKAGKKSLRYSPQRQTEEAQDAIKQFLQIP